MAKIKIEDLPVVAELTDEELEGVAGGVTFDAATSVTALSTYETAAGIRGASAGIRGAALDSTLAGMDPIAGIRG